MTDIAALNTKFRIVEAAKIIAGTGGLPKIKIATLDGTAEIYLHGAQITFWLPGGGKEVIFLSQQSRFEPGKAIRGGIPICFPWFGPKVDDPKAAQHGFARTMEWELNGLKRHANAVEVTLSLSSNEATKQLWPHDFHALYTLSVGTRLHLTLTVTNTGTEPLTFEEALHTYFSIGDATKTHITGLDQTSYLDNRDNLTEKTQEGDISLATAVDQIFLDTSATVVIHDPPQRRRITIEKQNSQTTVVWNPGPEGAAALSDMAGEEWKKMACVEASNVKAFAIPLAPGQSHTMSVTLSQAQEE